MDAKRVDDKKTKGSIGWIVALLVGVLVLLIAYTVILFECYKNRSFIFSPYRPPKPPGKYFYPNGGVEKLTAEDKKKRAAAINASYTPPPKSN